MNEKKYREFGTSLDDVASEMNVERDQLALYFSVVKKTKFLSWRKKLRIDEAKALLLDFPDLPVNAIGALVGIPDHSDFRRQFFELVGCFPQQWRDGTLPDD